ncbi:hypothetical protein [Ruegeria atlantica]|uniref:hypothetical protein n=1 Tax=Ruegeria atlantica TaxID=81569 RepID=UPI00147AD0DC|nr:hypothetical protein [Ruegeria atlantica]
MKRVGPSIRSDAVLTKTQSVCSLAVLIAGSMADPVIAGAVTIEDGIEAFDATQEETSTGLRNGSLVVAPIPFADPTLGTGVTLSAGYLFNMDEGSKPSLVGIAGLRSDNGSEAFGAAANFAFDNNRWQVETLFAKADFNYDLYTTIGELPVTQDGRIARVELSYGITSELSVGISTRYLDTTVNPGDGGLPPIPPPFNQFLNMEIVSPGFVLKFDRRDDTIYPKTGSILKTEFSHNFTTKGVTGDYSKAFVNYTHYLNPVPDGVVAARLATCTASTETPFFDQCSLGATDAFRGFPVTQFLDLRSVSIQLEYRHQLTKRIGAVAFVGTGQTGDSFSNLFSGTTHSAFGFGGRFRVSKKFPVDFSVDWARNSQGNDQLYIYVGQRF